VLADETELVGKDLLDFVGAFSDVDCVVERLEEWSSIASDICVSLPSAEFYRWEVLSLSAVRKWIETSAHLPSDEIIVWFDGRKTKGKIYCETLEKSRKAFATNQLLELPLAEQPLKSVWDDLNDFLKLLRVHLQFPRKVKPNNRQQLVLRARSLNERELPESSKPSPLELLRIETLILKLAAVADWMEARKSLNSLRPIRSAGLRASPVISFLTSPSSQTSFAAAIWRDEKHQITARFSEVDAVGGSQTPGLVQWVDMSSPAPDPCCKYKDFRNGVAVIIWRGPAIQAETSAIDSWAIVARLSKPVVYDPETDDVEGEMLSIPGRVTIDSAVTIRFDHSIPGALYGRRLTMQVGLVDTLKREDSNA
jgi:hypothetical protein